MAIVELKELMVAQQFALTDLQTHLAASCHFRGASGAAVPEDWDEWRRGLLESAVGSNDTAGAAIPQLVIEVAVGPVDCVETVEQVAAAVAATNP